MSNQWLITNYKGKYRILPVIDKNTNYFIEDDDPEVYIACKHGIKVEVWGLDSSKRTVLQVYIPSKYRGRSVIKELKANKLEYFDYDESDTEATFKFKSKYADEIIPFLQPKISGASISPFSTRNLPKNNVDIPEKLMQEYKNITRVIPKEDMLFVKNVNQGFLREILAIKLKEPRKKKPYDYKTEMKSMCLLKDTKGYIYKKGLWDEYMDYFKKKVESKYGRVL